MGFQSQSGQVGFKTQATEGVYADPGGAPAGIFSRLRSGGLVANRDLLIPDPEIGGSRDISDAYLGAVSFTGDYEFYARSKGVALLLKSALGLVESTADGEVGTHTITPTNGPLPWLSIEENVAGSFDTFQYTDAKVNTLHFEAEANGYLQGTAGIIARLQSAGHTKTETPAWDTNPMLVGTNILVTYGGITMPAKSFSFDLTNNLEDDDFRLGSFYLGDVTEKRREITFGLTLRPESSALWRQATYGMAAATEAGGITNKQELVITCETYENIGASSTKHSISFTCPKAAFQPFGVEPSGDDVIEHDVTLQALQPDPAVPILTAVVKNDLTTLP